MVKVGEIKVKSFLTKSRLEGVDYVINPYVGCRHKCMYCFAEYMQRLNGYEEAWGDFTDVKRCETAIPRDKISGKTVLLGTVTDAYHPFEKKYRVTESILKQLAGSTAKIEILTKSALVTRDIALFKQIPNIRVGFSINSLDDAFRKVVEPHASPAIRRIEALKALKAAGLDTFVFLSPIFPGITDFKEIIEQTAPYVNTFYFESLKLRVEYFSRILEYINQYQPHLNRLYHEIYRERNMRYWEALSREIHVYCQQQQLNYETFFYHEQKR